MASSVPFSRLFASPFSVETPKGAAEQARLYGNIAMCASSGTRLALVERSLLRYSLIRCGMAARRVQLPI